MRVGIVGLGLMGGSFARAYAAAGHTVLAFDQDAGVTELAMADGCVHGVLNGATASSCDLILIALYPAATIEFLKQLAPYIAKSAIVLDTCGVKRAVFEPCLQLAAAHGFTYVGGHPMAGTENSGFKHSRADMFRGASMIIVPAQANDLALIERVRSLLRPAGFGRLTVTTADKHDEMIAFTSQLAHVVSNAYMKSPTAGLHKGFSAGSYKDLTRVAWLNETMWTELFLDNRDYLIRELDQLTGALQQYRQALVDGDSQKLKALLAEGRRRKEEVDRK
jgi:prephenate dehydrogenase